MSPTYINPNLDTVLTEELLSNVTMDVLHGGAKFPITANVFEKLMKVVRRDQHKIIEDMIAQATTKFRAMEGDGKFEEDLMQELARWMEAKGFCEPSAKTSSIKAPGQINGGTALLTRAGDNMKGSL